MKVAVYTAIAGGYDPLLRPHPETPGVEWFAFVDRELESQGAWEQVAMYERESDDMGEHPSPRLRAKWYKLFPWKCLPPGYDASLWVDGSVEVLSAELLSWVEAADPIAMYRHTFLNCVYQEAMLSQGMLKYHDQPIAEQIAHYRKHGWPEHAGLWAGNIIARKHTPECGDLMEAWWAENIRWSIQDQISFPVVCKRLGIEPTEMPAPNNLVRFYQQPWKG